MKAYLTDVWLDTTFFGRATSKYMKYAKVAMIGVVAFGAGHFIGRLAKQIPMSTSIPMRAVFVLISLASFSMISLVLGTLRRQVSDRSQNQVQSVMRLLPLKRDDRWFFYILPLVLVGVLLLIFGIPLVISLAHAIQYPVWLGLLSYLIGLAIAFGIALHPRLKNYTYILLIGAITASLSRLLIMMMNPSLVQQFLVWLVMGGIFLLGMFGYRENYRSLYSQIGVARRRVASYSWYPGWFGAKLVRHVQLSHTLLVSITFCFVFAGVLFIRHTASFDIYSWFTFCGLFALAYGVEVRGISRKCLTAEILAIKDVGFFVIAEWLSSVISAVLIGLPVLIIALLSTRDSSLLVVFLSYQVFALTVGLAVGSFLVPLPGDVGSQFTSTCLALALFFAIPKISNMTDYGASGQIIGRLIFSAVGLLVIYIYEYRRRVTYG